MLVAAFKLLQNSVELFQGRIAGPSQVAPIHPLFEDLSDLSQVPPSQIGEEVRSAEWFALLPLLETKMLLHWQATAGGMIVVSTTLWSSLLLDRLDGFFVPIRDPGTIVKYLQQHLDDRSLRQSMGLAARQCSHDFASELAGDRLLSSLGLI